MNSGVYNRSPRARPGCLGHHKGRVPRFNRLPTNVAPGTSRAGGPVLFCSGEKVPPGSGTKESLWIFRPTGRRDYSGGVVGSRQTGGPFSLHTVRRARATSSGGWGGSLEGAQWSTRNVAADISKFVSFNEQMRIAAYRHLTSSCRHVATQSSISYYSVFRLFRQ